MPETCCVVPNCSEKGRHILPKDKARRDAWVHAIKRGKSIFEKWSPPSNYSYICERHFTDDDYHGLTYSGAERQKRSLKKTAVPSIFPWTSQESVTKASERRNRYNVRAERKRKLSFESLETEWVPEFVATKIVEECDELNVGACEDCATDSLNPVFDEISVSETVECQTYETVEMGIQTAKCPAFSIFNYQKDDAAVHFYTGLESFTKFIFVLNTLGPAAYHLRYVYHTVTSLSVPDQFFLVLMKLRRHYTHFELSRMFSIAESVVPNIFVTWVIYMEKQWKELNIWPSKELVKHFAPSSFRRNYPSTRVIIDGTECPIKKPRNPTAQQASFSTYKNKNTVKVLVGATPGGLISYVSDAYGGATSDRQIIERSSLMKMCSQKDSIMADKGFNVQDIFAPYDVHINIPTFFKKKNRLSNETVIRDRKISSKRVHIERLIGLGKTYRILVEPMTATEAKLSTQIIFSCFMLCNFRQNIVSSYA